MPVVEGPGPDHERNRLPLNAGFGCAGAQNLPIASEMFIPFGDDLVGFGNQIDQDGLPFPVKWDRVLVITLSHDIYRHNSGHLFYRVVPCDDVPGAVDDKGGLGQEVKGATHLTFKIADICLRLLLLDRMPDLVCNLCELWYQFPAFLEIVSGPGVQSPNDNLFTSSPGQYNERDGLS